MKRYLIQTAMWLIILASSYSAIGQEIPAFDEENSFQYLLAQVAFGPRNPGSEGHQNCRNYLVNELKKFTSRVNEQAFLHYDGLTGRTLTLTNIIAQFNPGTEPRILLSAHWDTRPRADRDPDPANRNRPILGANDGASGVAVLLEVARQLSLNPPPIGVDIVFFDGEDYGREGYSDEYFLGSRYFVKNNQTFFPRYAILLDMVGDKNLKIPIEGNSWQFAPDVVHKVWKQAEMSGKNQFINTVDGFINDDHVILNQGGIPAIDIIDFAYPDESHRYWHTLQDTPDKCSPQSLGVVGEVLLALIYGAER